jgi:large subunit ribosomal protein L9
VARIEVILRQDVEKVGLRGDVVNVSRGYARNFLFPRRLAEAATPAKVAELQKHEAQRARHEAATFEQAREIAGTLERVELRFDVQAGPTGTLFGSVTPTNIADELWEKNKIRVDRRKIGTDTIKRIGRYEIPIELFQDVTASVKTLVVPEGGELPPEEELAAMEAAEARAKAEADAATHPELELDLDELDAATAAQDPEVSDAAELQPTEADVAAEVPDDEFDRAAYEADRTER